MDLEVFCTMSKKKACGYSIKLNATYHFIVVLFSLTFSLEKMWKKHLD